VSIRSLVDDLVSSAFDEQEVDEPLEFPFELRVDREETSLSVDGDPHRFDLFTCGSSAAAQGQIDGRTIQVVGMRGDVETLKLQRASTEQLSSLVHELKRRQSRRLRLRLPGS
jgi:hypothetical protein